MVLENIADLWNKALTIIEKRSVSLALKHG